MRAGTAGPTTAVRADKPESTLTVRALVPVDPPRVVVVGLVLPADEPHAIERSVDANTSEKGRMRCSYRAYRTPPGWRNCANGHSERSEESAFASGGDQQIPRYARDDSGARDDSELFHCLKRAI